MKHQLCSSPLRSWVRHLSVSSNTPVGASKNGFIIALKKQEGQGMVDEDREADTHIDILSLMHKSNQRFTLSHSRDSKGAGKDETEEEDPDKLFAPQHRRYLTFPKVKQAGSLSKREKIDNQNRLDRAVSNAHKYALESLGLVDQSAGHNTLTNYKGMNAIIEDKIQLAILQGDFDNLKSSNAPKDDFVNPFVDRTQDLCFEILKKNGIKPDWIESQQTMTTLNNHLRALTRCLLYQHLVEASPGGTDTAGKQHVATLLHTLAPDEALCHHFTDIYNLQAPHYSLTRGRISLQFVLEQAWADWLNAGDDRLDPVRALEEARREVELHVHLVSRLRAECNDRNSGNRGAYCSHSGPGNGGGGVSSGGGVDFLRYQHSRQVEAQRSDGLGAGQLAMSFFMAPVDRLISVINRLI